MDKGDRILLLRWAVLERKAKPGGGQNLNVPNRNYLVWSVLPGIVVFTAPAMLVVAAIGVIGMIVLTICTWWQFKDWHKDPNW